MSREINMDDPSSWSNEDRLYLQQRGKLPSDVPHLRTSPPEPTLPLNTGDVNTWKGDLEDVVFDDDDEDVEVTEEGTEGTYESLTVSELKDELKARGLPTSGTKDELVARLEEDDTAPESEDDEEV